ncbi:hypothetical protein HUT19_19245 [Streptomyces sp. NA02950]|uniref:hypothetical protein n=1 Tax=Streptomyces sp. NA02950 TaxID=2742137 RepID=UPI00159291A5|nr:hypothetical protein [Streptomyces sp. NA02950]QKV93631.1 hypothetical protein HUT19_19245 [Streptomyces sp. NA02950]
MAEQPVQGESSVPQRPRTYDEIINDSWTSGEEQNRAKADSLLGHMAALLFQRGDTKHVQLLLLVRNAVIEYDHDSRSDDLWLEIDPGNEAAFTDEVHAHLRSVFERVSGRLDYNVPWLGFRETLPRVGPDWRQRLQEMMTTDRPTNQARRTMPEKPQWVMDRLAFTNHGEQRVYQALKHLQEKELPAEETISIFPLPNGRVLGHTWEPDLLVTYRGRAGVLEIDGPDHRVRRAMDTSRDHLLRDAGIAYVDRVPVEVIDNPQELMASLKRFLRRLRECP